MDADDYCDMMLPEDDENDMTRIDKIKAQIETGGEGCVPYGSLSELLELVQDMAGALEDVIRVADRKTVEFDNAHAALAKYKAWNGGE